MRFLTGLKSFMAISAVALVSAIAFASALSDARDAAYAKSLDAVDGASAAATWGNLCESTADGKIADTSLTSAQRAEASSLKADAVAARASFEHYWYDELSSNPDGENSYDNTDPWDWNYTYVTRLSRLSFANAKYARAIEMEGDGATEAATIAAYDDSTSSLQAFCDAADLHISAIIVITNELDAIVP